MKDSSTSNKSHWLDIAEIAAVAGSVGGSIAGVFFKQFLWATIPLSASAALAILNHQRLKSLIREEQKAIAFLVEQNEAEVNDFKIEYLQNYQASKTRVAELEGELGQVRNLATVELARLQQEQKADFKSTSQALEILQNSLAKLDSLSQKLEQDIHTVDHKQKETSKVVRELKAIDIFTQNIQAQINVIQSYFERGLAYQRLGNKHRAISDYSRTLELDISHAPAHHNRGVLYAEMGLEQKAVIDLRRASQLYFDQGNLDKYRETRDLVPKIHQNQNIEAVDSNNGVADNNQDTESVIVGNLFA